MRNNRIRRISQIAITASLYTVVTFVFQSMAFGPIQFRPAEALVILVAFGSQYKYGLTLGCFLANLLTSANVVDMICGSLITFLSCVVAEKLYDKWKSPLSLTLPHVTFTGLLVPFYLHILFNLPYWVVVVQLIASCLLNNLLLGVVLFPLVSQHGRKL